jgi:hypothetical protein
MNKLPKEIYVHEETGQYFVNAEDAAVSDTTVTLGVYKLVGKVEVSTQIKQEIVVKKSPKKVAQKPAESIPVDRVPLLDEMHVTN